ncbi:hypothetical protein E2C01_025938 [Portunus trituberculatus]|uniref:Uncharacterized protein n=1 Tax=Portunus trituberculatus TaxID=210409 RepID=A0A5B7EH27_PORTR|nr:hypothetical protein [Portunus trituberculatus]
MHEQLSSCFAPSLTARAQPFTDTSVRLKKTFDFQDMICTQVCERQGHEPWISSAPFTFPSLPFPPAARPHHSHLLQFTTILTRHGFPPPLGLPT